MIIGARCSGVNKCDDCRRADCMANHPAGKARDKGLQAYADYVEGYPDDDRGGK